MDSYDENNTHPQNGFWQIFKAVFSAIVTLMTIVGGVFVFVKFSIIDSKDINYQSQIDTLKTTISQYESKISFLEKENQTLTAERDRYYDYLINIPESIPYLNNLIIELEDQNTELLQSANTSNKDSEFQKYYITYDNVKENNAIIDTHTGLIFSMNDISMECTGNAIISLPGEPSETRAVISGEVIEFRYNDNNYQIIVSMISWTASSYSIIIKEI